MRTTLIRAAWVIALVAIGWVAGRAQDRPEPHFVLDIEAPQGWTKVVCVRGCELVGARSTTTAERMPEFRYGCGVTGTLEEPRLQPLSPSPRCKGTVLGWTAPPR